MKVTLMNPRTERVFNLTTTSKRGYKTIVALAKSLHYVLVATNY